MMQIVLHELYPPLPFIFRAHTTETYPSVFCNFYILHCTHVYFRRLHYLTIVNALSDHSTIKANHHFSNRSSLTKHYAKIFILGDDKKQTASNPCNLAKRLRLVNSHTGIPYHITTPLTNYRPRTGLTTRNGLTSSSTLRTHTGLTTRNGLTSSSTLCTRTDPTSGSTIIGSTISGSTIIGSTISGSTIIGSTISGSTISAPTSTLSSTMATSTRYTSGYGINVDDRDRHRTTGAVYGGSGRTFAGCFADWK